MTAQRRQQLLALLGDLPPRTCPVVARLIGQDERDGRVVERLELDLNGMEAVPALFVRPAGSIGRRPVVLYQHAHGGNYRLGKQELLEGHGDLLQGPYVDDLLHRGWSVLAIDHWLFGERSGRDELDLFKEMLWQGRVLWGMMVHDSLRALDYLCTRPDVDPARIATLGLSMGSTMAWWTAAVDERIAVCVDLCCLTDFHTLMAVKGLHGHGIYYFVPGLIKAFTSAEINGLIVPRPHLACAGLRDLLTPPAGLERIDEELTRRYREAGVPERWRLIQEDTGHGETPMMRAQALAFLERWLGGR